MLNVRIVKIEFPSIGIKIVTSFGNSQRDDLRVGSCDSGDYGFGVRDSHFKINYRPDDFRFDFSVGVFDDQGVEVVLFFENIV